MNMNWTAFILFKKIDQHVETYEFESECIENAYGRVALVSLVHVETYIRIVRTMVN